MPTPMKSQTAVPHSQSGRHPFWQLRQEMEDAFDNILGDRGLFRGKAEMIPSIDLSETVNEIRVETDLPGFKPEEVDIEINENYLTISGSHTDEIEEPKAEDRKYHRVERRKGTFSRTVLLPCAVDQTRVNAELKEGVLTVTLPKTAEAASRKITVKG